MSRGRARVGSGSRAAAETRPRELQDPLNRHLYHPLALRLARLLAPTPITPNMVSIAGGLVVVGAAIAYAQPGWPWPALAGLALHMSWHVLDGADGDLARMTRRASPIGEMVDGICDYASHVVLYVMLAWLAEPQFGAGAWILASAAGISRIFQANHFEVQRRQYQNWVYGTPWLRTARPEGGGGADALSLLGSIYLGLAKRLTPNAALIDRAINERRGDAERLQRAALLVRQHLGGRRTGLPILGANYRTIFLGLSMLAGSPVYYFVFEAVVLNIQLLRSIRSCEEGAGRILAGLAHQEERSAR